MTAKEFLFKMPEKVNLLTIEGMNTVFHFDLEGEGGGLVTIIVEKGEMRVEDGLVGEPNCVIKAKAEDFKKIVKGELNPMMAILTGKMRIVNQIEMMKFAKLLGWM